MRTRFAPSPTGPLHLGHAYSAGVAWRLARELGGQFFLRIEDIDTTRSRSHWEQQIFDDLHWLGLSWPDPVLRQSQNMKAYRRALESLSAKGLIYACSCTRRDIKEALSAPQEGVEVIVGPDGPVYPGTCRGKRENLGMSEAALRLNMANAVELLADQFRDCFAGFEELSEEHKDRAPFNLHKLPETVGDIVIARRDIGTSYHLSVVVDDAAQEITHVVRGADLFDATKIHVVLQKLLGYPTPTYLHHDLIRDDNGTRLAKRDDARALSTYRDDGLSPADVWHLVGLDV